MVLMLWLLPESVRYMGLRQQPAERIRKVLVRISHDARHASAFVLNEVRVGAAAATDAARKTGLALDFVARISARHVDDVAGLLHGVGHRLRPGQLDAGAV